MVGLREVIEHAKKLGTGRIAGTCLFALPVFWRSFLCPPGFFHSASLVTVTLWRKYLLNLLPSDAREKL